MAVYGNLDAWADTFDQGLIPPILDLICSAWQTFVKPTHTELEPQITRRLCVHLCKTRANLLPVRIECESTEYDLTTAEEKGRIDVKFINPPNCREDIYFAFECKKLNVLYSKKWESQATEYVTEGMRRFINGKYAASLTDGGMLGYVMDGQVNRAIDVVNDRILSRCHDLCMNPHCNLSPSTLRPDLDHIKVTLHSLSSRTFTLHHIFLSA